MSHRSRHSLTTVWAALLLIAVPQGALTDEITLTDGSHVVGQVLLMDQGKVHVKTEFAGDLVIDATKIQGITTDKPFSVQLNSGDRAVGNMRYSPETGQIVTAPALGTVSVPVQDITAVWAEGDESPAVVALKAQLYKMQNPWTLRLHIGADGQSGNTERAAVNGRLEIKRTTEKDRLMIYSQGRFSHENGNDTIKEVLGGLGLEVDISPKWFVFGKTEVEFDKFEDLDLRTTLSGGLGYFVIREPGHELKFRGGVGFQHESFNTGVNNNDGVAELGMDYLKQINPSLLFTHHTTYYPTFDDFADYRIVMENALEVPITPDKTWTFRLGVKNDYNGNPEPGVEYLDSFYFLNIVWDVK